MFILFQIITKQCFKDMSKKMDLSRLAYTMSQKSPLYYELEMQHRLIIINSFFKHGMHTIFFRKIDDFKDCVHILFLKLKPLIEQIIALMNTTYSRLSFDVLFLHEFPSKTIYGHKQVYNQTSNITASQLEQRLGNSNQSTTGFILTFTCNCYTYSYKQQQSSQRSFSDCLSG